MILLWELLHFSSQHCSVILQKTCSGWIVPRMDKFGVLLRPELYSPGGKPTMFSIVRGGELRGTVVGFGVFFRTTVLKHAGKT